MTQQPRRGPGRPTASEEVPTPDQVLDHALEAFAGQGYEAVSVRRLSAELGMGHTFLSDRYGSKDALWRAAVRHALEKISPEVATELADDGRDDLARLVAAVRALHRAAARSAHLAWLLDQEARLDSTRLEFLHEQLAPINAELKALFDRSVAAGLLRPMPWYLFYFLVTAPTILYSQPPLARLMGRPEGADDHDLMSELLLGGLLGPAQDGAAQDEAAQDGAARKR